MAKKDKFLLDENGKPYRTADGKPMPLSNFDNDPSDKAPDRTDAEIDADIKELGLDDE